MSRICQSVLRAALTRWAPSAKRPAAQSRITFCNSCIAMEHIISSTPGEIDYWRYHHYVDSIRNRLPSHVYAFASNFDHFGLESHSSLHDAWLERLTVDEIAEGERQEIPRLEIRLSFLGPFHDRRIHLHYT